MLPRGRFGKQLSPFRRQVKEDRWQTILAKTLDQTVEKLVAQPAQPFAQLAVVVDRAVKDNRKPQCRVDHWLLGGFGKIDDLEPSVAERDAAVSDDAPAVGAAGREGIEHRLD